MFFTFSSEVSCLMIGSTFCRFVVDVEVLPVVETVVEDLLFEVRSVERTEGLVSHVLSSTRFLIT